MGLYCDLTETGKVDVELGSLRVTTVVSEGGAVFEAVEAATVDSKVGFEVRLEVGL